MARQTTMNIKEIVDKSLREAGIQANDWSLTARIEDTNSYYSRLAEKATQIGSKTPPSAAEAISETFTVVAGSQVFTRTIPDVPIVRVDFLYDGSTIYDRVPEDQSRAIASWNTGDIRFWANEKQIFVEEGKAGTLRVTTAHGAITLFTLADYNLGSGWPSLDFLPSVFHDLVWLKMAYRQAKKFKKDHAASLKDEIDELQLLFDNRYGRDAVQDLAFETDEGVRGNNR